MVSKSRIAIFLFSIMLISTSIQAQLVLNSMGPSTTIDFDNTVAGVNNGSFSATGFVTTPVVGQLDTDGWRLSSPVKGYGLNVTGGNYALGCGGGGINDQGGIWCFQGGSISGKALGMQPSNSAFTPGELELKVVNNTGQYITSIDLSYVLHVRNDKPRGTNVSVRFRYATTVNGIAIAPNASPYDVGFPGVNYTTPTTAVGTNFTAVPQNGVLSGIYVKPGEEFFIEWTLTDAGGFGERDEIGLDDIVLDVAGSPDLTFYSRGNGEQNSNPVQLPFPIGVPLVNWSTVPSGGVTYSMSPLEPLSDLVIQNGHTVTWNSVPNRSTINDLTVNVGGRLIGRQPGTSTSQNYICLRGDLICNGSIGNASGAQSGVSLNIEPGPHLIGGIGTINIGRIRKSNVYGSSGSAGQADLDVNADVRLHFGGLSITPGMGIYNNRQASDGGTNRFNITVNGNLTVDGQMGIDGTNPLTNTIEQGGLVSVNGTLTVDRGYFMTTSNNSIPVGVSIAPGGVLSTSHVIANASGTAGHDLTVLDGGRLELTGVSTGTTVWSSYSAINNTYDLQGTVEYSRTGAQSVIALDYHDLILSGSGVKTFAAATPMQVFGDISIEGAAVFDPVLADVEVHGDWTNYDQSGFSEGTSEVRFYNNGTPGVTEIRCLGGEVFHDIGIMSGHVDMETDVRVDNVIRLDARLNLNTHELHIDQPTGLSILTPSGNEVIVSEDTGFDGRITYNVGSASGLLTFPFGTISGQPVYNSFLPTAGSAGEVSMATYATPTSNLPLPSSPIPVLNINSAGGLTPDNAAATVDRYHLVLSSGAGSMADVVLGFTNSELPSAPYNSVFDIVGQHYDALTDKWLPPPSSGQFVLPNSPAPGSNVLFFEDVTSFGVFGLAHSSSPLPVELLTFSAEAKTDYDLVKWSTASETDNDRFELYWSADGETFDHLTTLQGQGNSSVVVEYEVQNSRVVAGMNYYRLEQIDHDGTAAEPEYTAVFRSTDDLHSTFKAWVNESELHYTTTADLPPEEMRLYDMKGNEVRSWRLNEPSGQLSLAGLSPAVYLLRWPAHEQIQSRRLYID